jgi:hypothetical protein
MCEPYQLAGNLCMLQPILVPPRGPGGLEKGEATAVAMLEWRDAEELVPWKESNAI